MSKALSKSPSKKLIFKEIIPPKQGFATVVNKEHYFRITDLEGKQVADVIFVNANNVKEKNSNGISMSRQMNPGEPYKLKDKLTTGDIIFSSAYRPMATITADTPIPAGVHKLVLHSCNRTLFETFGFPGREGCWEILSRVLKKYDITPEEIPDSFDVFMNVEHDLNNGEWRIKEPVSRPGDFIEFRMEMECIVALSNCPMDVIAPTNGWKCTPIKVEIFKTKN